MAGNTRRIAALLTVHDRKAKTLECLAALRGQRGCEGVSVPVFLVDDGSSDGTAAAVRERFPDVEIIPGSGELYWNGGMRLAFETAARHDPDFFLLLNDDTNLDADAIARLLRTHDDLRAAGRPPCIVVGSTRDPVTGVTSYGGQDRVGRWAPRFALVPPAGVPVPCDTMNANCALVPREVAARVGNLSAEYTHRFGDLDYGLRATAAGCECWVAPSSVGTCAHNPNLGSFVDESLPVVVRWRRMLGPKGLPIREWRAFTGRHCGPVWPVYWLGTYVKFWGVAPYRALRRSLRGAPSPRRGVEEGKCP